MAILLDTNILLRITDAESPGHELVHRAADTLVAQQEALCFTNQNLVEFWNVCTRPVLKNGLGLSIPDADTRAKVIESSMHRLPEDDRIHYTWRRLVRDHSVSRTQVHDARLVAAMLVHKVPSILTLNGRDFVRYPGISVLDPHDLQ